MVQKPWSEVLLKGQRGRSPAAQGLLESDKEHERVEVPVGGAFLRACAPAVWTSLLRATPPRQSPEEARRLLRRVGDAADDALRSLGILPGLGRSLDRLRPGSYADLQHGIRLSHDLGPEAFRLLLEQYEEHAGLTSSEFFTPRAVTRMMAELLVREEDEQLTLCDPYLRGGELLTSAVDTVRGAGCSAASLTVCGTGSHEDTLRLAGMHLMLHGVRGTPRHQQRSAVERAGPAVSDRRSDSSQSSVQRARIRSAHQHAGAVALRSPTPWERLLRLGAGRTPQAQPRWPLGRAHAQQRSCVGQSAGP
ncbi:SAM-dependent DNA methyltransferase [Streptomyces sp. NA02950]|nr:SAM-dependent DNA methyltransferase [Streptomyces sp. NA02950]